MNLKKFAKKTIHLKITDSKIQFMDLKNVHEFKKMFTKKIEKKREKKKKKK